MFSLKKNQWMTIPVLIPIYKRRNHFFLSCNWPGKEGGLKGITHVILILEVSLDTLGYIIIRGHCAYGAVPYICAITHLLFNWIDNNNQSINCSVKDNY